jgi:tetratricopeptide (TPR) repeat protein
VTAGLARRAVDARFEVDVAETAAAAFGEQRALADLSIFRGGFSGAAAQAVAQAGLRALNMLAHRSLVRRAADGRYDLHPLIRAYAAEHVEDPIGLAARMGAFYAGWLSSHRDAIRVGETTALSIFSAEGPNIAIAWGCALAASDRESLSVMLDGLLWLTEYRGWFRASERLFNDALGALPDDDASRLLRARLFTALGHCLLRLGRREDAQAAHASAVSTLDNAPDSPGLREHRAFALLLMGTALTDPPEQMRVFARSLALYESEGDAWGIGAALNNLGECAELLGDMPDAQRYHRASLAHCLGIGDQPGVAFARANLGGLLRLEGRLDEAEAELRAGLEVANALGFDYARGLLTQNLAACAWARRDAPTARRLAEDAERLERRARSEAHQPREEEGGDAELEGVVRRARRVLAHVEPLQDVRALGSGTAAVPMTTGVPWESMPGASSASAAAPVTTGEPIAATEGAASGSAAAPVMARTRDAVATSSLPSLRHATRRRPSTQPRHIIASHGRSG